MVTSFWITILVAICLNSWLRVMCLTHKYDTGPGQNFNSRDPEKSQTEDIKNEEGSEILSRSGFKNIHPAQKAICPTCMDNKNPRTPVNQHPPSLSEEANEKQNFKPKSRRKCGVPDRPGLSLNVSHARLGKRSLYWTIYHGSTWSKRDLTYNINTPPKYPNRHQLEYVITAALRAWERVTQLTFTRKRRGAVDIEVNFLNGRHGDGSPFDGNGGILAHAFFPYDNSPGLSGDAHFDADEDWGSRNFINRNAELYCVAIHEFGHSLGLMHSRWPLSIMWPWMKGDCTLSKFDIAVIQTIYGVAKGRFFPRRPFFFYRTPPSSSASASASLPSSPSRPDKPNRTLTTVAPTETPSPSTMALLKTLVTLPTTHLTPPTHVTRLITNVTQSTSNVSRSVSYVTRPTANATWPGINVTQPTTRLIRPIQNVTRPSTSVTKPTSHFTKRITPVTKRASRVKILTPDMTKPSTHSTRRTFGVTEPITIVTRPNRQVTVLTRRSAGQTIYETKLSVRTSKLTAKTKLSTHANSPIPYKTMKPQVLGDEPNPRETKPESHVTKAKTYETRYPTRTARNITRTSLTHLTNEITNLTDPQTHITQSTNTRIRSSVDKTHKSLTEVTGKPTPLIGPSNHVTKSTTHLTERTTPEAQRAAHVSEGTEHVTQRTIRPTESTVRVTKPNAQITQPLKTFKTGSTIHWLGGRSRATRQMHVTSYMGSSVVTGEGLNTALAPGTITNIAVNYKNITTTFSPSTSPSSSSAAAAAAASTSLLPSTLLSSSTSLSSSISSSTSKTSHMTTRSTQDKSIETATERGPVVRKDAEVTASLHQGQPPPVVTITTTMTQILPPSRPTAMPALPSSLSSSFSFNSPLPSIFRKIPPVQTLASSSQRQLLTSSLSSASPLLSLAPVPSPQTTQSAAPPHTISKSPMPSSPSNQTSEETSSAPPLLLPQTILYQTRTASPSQSKPPNETFQLLRTPLPSITPPSPRSSPQRPQTPVAPLTTVSLTAPPQTQSSSREITTTPQTPVPPQTPQPPSQTSSLQKPSQSHTHLFRPQALHTLPVETPVINTSSFQYSLPFLTSATFQQSSQATQPLIPPSQSSLLPSSPFQSQPSSPSPSVPSPKFPHPSPSPPWPTRKTNTTVNTPKLLPFSSSIFATLIQPTFVDNRPESERLTSTYAPLLPTVSTLPTTANIQPGLSKESNIFDQISTLGSRERNFPRPSTISDRKYTNDQGSFDVTYSQIQPETFVEASTITIMQTKQIEPGTRLINNIRTVEPKFKTTVEPGSASTDALWVPITAEIAAESIKTTKIMNNSISLKQTVTNTTFDTHIANITRSASIATEPVSIPGIFVDTNATSSNIMDTMITSGIYDYDVHIANSTNTYNINTITHSIDNHFSKSRNSNTYSFININDTSTNYVSNVTEANVVTKISHFFNDNDSINSNTLNNSNNNAVDSHTSHNSDSNIRGSTSINSHHSDINNKSIFIYTAGSETTRFGNTTDKMNSTNNSLYKNINHTTSKTEFNIENITHSSSRSSESNISTLDNNAQRNTSINKDNIRFSSPYLNLISIPTIITNNNFTTISNKANNSLTTSISANNTKGPSYIISILNGTKMLHLPRTTLTANIRHRVGTPTMSIFNMNVSRTVTEFYRKNSHVVSSIKKSIADIHQNTNDRVNWGGKRTLNKLLRGQNKYNSQLRLRDKMGTKSKSLQHFEALPVSRNRKQINRESFRRVKRSFKDVESFDLKAGTEIQTPLTNIRRRLLQSTSNISTESSTSKLKLTTLEILSKTLAPDVPQQTFMNTWPSIRDSSITKTPRIETRSAFADAVTLITPVSTNSITTPLSSLSGYSSNTACIISADATFVDPDHTLHVFSGNILYRFSLCRLPNKQKTSSPIYETFSGIPANITAAASLSFGRKRQLYRTYLIRGHNIWRYRKCRRGFCLDRGYPRNITEEFGITIQGEVTAAYVHTRRRMLYLFNGTNSFQAVRCKKWLRRQGCSVISNTTPTRFLTSLRDIDSMFVDRDQLYIIHENNFFVTSLRSSRVQHFQHGSFSKIFFGCTE